MDINSYESVLNFLNEYFSIRVKDENYLNELKKLIEGSRAKKTVTIRPIQLLFLEYRKSFSDYSVVSREEKQMWIDLLDCWQ